MSVQPYLRLVAAQGRKSELVGPFVAHFNPALASEGSNYAIPADGARPTAADVAALRDAFAVRGCRPRLEYVPATAPDAEPVLLEHGFAVELRTTVMCHRGADPHPAVAGLTLHELRPDATDAELTDLLRVQTTAFGDELTDDRLRLARRWLGRWSTVLARLDGEPAGAGVALDVLERTAELVGIATAAPARRRGVATAVTGELARLVRARGAETVFLTPGSPEAGRVYERAGFVATDEMLHLRAV